MNANIDKPIRAGTCQDLDGIVEEHDRVLAEFYTKGCTLCQSIEPVLGNVARSTDVTVVMINPETDLSLVDEYDIRSVPTLVLFEDGERVGRLAKGFQGAEEIIAFVEENAGGSIRSPTDET
ncbi:co-chaperone YbbN [Halalkalicoccus sp. NIPERK01]|uniref:thioredoxin family protein n=1 Tax=Halalkalicoccus sp. NIPERK01 TaxID=3053469 RepID=UPI00256F60A3|nr:thioredoxin family protein [Halalkalicoccus sp. NIPERK01]MDL5361692.1 thioredoxin family protein [Halalkalicoccus sp. NIPERK01]